MHYQNKYNLPQSYVDVINKLTYDLSETDLNRVGITTLINPPRQRLLTVRHWTTLEEDVSESLWRVLGASVHYILKKSETKDRLIEEKIEHKIEDITIVAKPDLYDDKTKSVNDWKITSVWSFRFGNKIEWEKQLNLYAFSLRKFGLEVNKISIYAILRDWSKNEFKKYNDYPPIPFQKVDIKLWSFEEQEKYIKERIQLYKSCIQLKDNELPLCSPEERWKREDSFAVYKNNNQTATRVFATENEAEKYIIEIGVTKDRYKIVKREGVDVKCLDYCICNRVCDYFLKNYEKNNSCKL